MIQARATRTNRNILKIAGLGLFILVIELLFFRNIIGNDNLIGSDGDARYIDLILEHYYRWLHGEERFTDLRCFYPVTNTISYSDMLLGLAIPFCALRTLGASMFLANKIGLILIHCFGTVCTVILLDRKLKLKLPAVLIGTVTFCYANSLAVKSWHNQMLAVCFVPFILLCLFGFFTRLDKRSVRRCLSGVGAIASLALLFYTSFYNAYYLLIYGAFLLIVFLILLMRRGVPVFRAIGGFLKQNPLECIGYAVFGVAIMLPFLKIYLPTLQSSGGWEWNVTKAMLPGWRDFLNVSPNNCLYGAFLGGPFFKLAGFYAGELQTGFPWVTFLLFWISLVGVCLLCPKHAKSKVAKPQKQSPKAIARGAQKDSAWYLSLLTVAVGIAVVCCFVLMLKVRNHSLWFFVYRFLPGASGIRAVSRFNMFLTLPVAIVIAWFANYAIPRLPVKQTPKALCCTALICFLVAENTLSVGVKSLWNISDAEQLTADVATPPSDCSLFFLADAKGDFSKDDKGYQLVAWEIAYRYNLRVINGHSGQFPPGWKAMSPKHGADAYEASINRWIADYALDNVYCYDISENRWYLWEGAFPT